jgi:hypothetical protein
MSSFCQTVIIDRERELLKRIAQKWGFSHERTLRQSERVDRLIYDYMQNQDE